MVQKQGVKELQQENEALKKQLAGLRESNEKYRGLLENLNEVLYTLDHNAAITYISPNIAKISGYSPSEVIGRPFTDFVHPDDLPGRIENFQRVFYGEDLVTEYRLLLKSGDSVWARTHGRPIMRDGEFRGVQGMLVDISDKKEAEAALQQSEKKFRDLFDNSADAVFIYSLNGWMLEVNEIACRHLGYSREELLEMTPMDLVPSQEIPKVMKGIQTISEKGGLVVESVHRRKDGIEYPVEIKARNVEFDGEPAILAVARDITGRKIREGMLRESEWQKNLILNSAEEKIIHYDDEFRIIWANRAAASIVDRNEAEMAGLRCYELFHQRSEPCPDCIVQKARETGLPQYIERREFNGTYWSQRAYPVTEDSGEVSTVVLFAQDVTAQKQAQEENARLQEQFRQFQKLESIGRLAGGVAHDLNNLLSPILGYGEMLLTGADLGENQRNKLDQMVDAGKRARALVRQLLAFSRKQMLEFTTIDLNELLQSFENLLGSTLNENITLRFKPAEGLPLFKGDAGQLEQVIMNLVVNARDAMPHGGEVIIETAAVELDENYANRRKGVTPGDYVMLAVSDTGCGMDEDTRKQVFEPFFTTKSADQGTGMGLSTVYGIVKQHGGNIWAYSEPGLGTTFRVYLPVSAELSIPRAQEAGAREEERPEPNRSKTILVAEDEETVRNLVVAMLERQGYTVLVGESGEEVISLLDDQNPWIDLLLTDVVLPDMNGKSLYQEVSARDFRAPVLYMSGYTEEVIAYHGVLESGVNFIQKPFSLEDLESKINEALEH